MSDKTKSKEEIQEFVKARKSKTTDNIPCGDGLAGKICERNTSKTNKKKAPKDFAKKFKKSYDYRDHGVMIDAKDQQAAEETVSPKVLDYFEKMHVTMEKGEVNKLNLGNGVLTLTKKDEGLFNGFYSDSDGQVVEKFDDDTLAMVAKNLMLKGWIGEEVIPEEVLMSEPEEASEVEVPTVQPSEAKYVKIKCGDFEFELRKSLTDFAKSWKKPANTDLKKAVGIWKKKRVGHFTEKQAVKEILENWDMFGEDFNQVLFAVQKSRES